MDKTRSFVVAVPYLAHGPKGQRVLVIDFTCSGSSVPLCYITTIALATSWLINQLHHYTAMHPTHQYCSFDVQDQLWCCKRYPFKFSWSLKVSLSLLSWAISESRIHLDFSLNEIKPINMEGTTSELPPSRIISLSCQLFSHDSSPRWGWWACIVFKFVVRSVRRQRMDSLKGIIYRTIPYVFGKDIQKKLAHWWNKKCGQQ